MRMRTVYLQRMLSINGRNALGGRVLLDRLRTESEDLVLAHMVDLEEHIPGMSAAVRQDVLSETEFLRFAPTVVVLEEGLFTGEAGGWRIARELAEEFVTGGGTLVVADVSWNILQRQRSAYREASLFLGATAAYRGQEPLESIDNRRNWDSNKQIRCLPDRMITSDWLRPVYDGIPEILCGWPVRLDSFGDILASGNTDSTRTYSGMHGGEPDNVPWASVRRTGAGFVVLLTAGVTHDAWLEGCPHNTTWLVNVCRFLSDAADTERRRAQATVKSPESLFLSHSSRDKEIVSATFRMLTGEHAVGSWIDTEELLPGDRLPEHLAGAVARATTFVLFWSASAARSAWVRRELDIAFDTPTPALVVVRLDDTAVPERLAEVVRIEAADMSALEIAGRLAETLRLRDRRARIEEARQRGAAAEAAEARRRAAEAEVAESHPRDVSLTRGPRHRREQGPEPLFTGGRLTAPELITTARSNFRIDILSFLGTSTLVTGSAALDSGDVATLRRLGLVEAVAHVSCPTGMDGHLDDHAASRRHLLYGYEDVMVVDRDSGDVVATVRCDRQASVCSAAWNPQGDRLVVGSTNNLTVADDRGRRLVRKNLMDDDAFHSAPSVAWQPSLNIVYAVGHRVVVADPDGRTLRAFDDLDSFVTAVTVSPSGRYIAGTARNGKVAIWSEWGDLLITLDGMDSDLWSASRCIAFSPDERYLCQAASVGSRGFLLFEPATGKVVRVEEPKTGLVAFHPGRPGVLVTAAEDRLSFWQLPVAEG